MAMLARTLFELAVDTRLIAQFPTDGQITAQRLDYGPRGPIDGEVPAHAIKLV